MIQVPAFNLLEAPAFQFWAFSGSGSFGSLSGRVIMHKSANKDKTRAFQMQQDREAYLKLSAGSGSATDSATSAARNKMATTVEARIISNVVKVVEIWSRGLCRNERQWAVTSTYWKEGKWVSNSKRICPVSSSFLYSLFCTLDQIFIYSHPQLSPCPRTSSSLLIIFRAQMRCKRVQSLEVAVELQLRHAEIMDKPRLIQMLIRHLKYVPLPSLNSSLTRPSKPRLKVWATEP